MNITDNIRFSRYLFLDQFNNQSSRSLSLYRLRLNCLHYILVFQQCNSNLIQSGFVVFALYRLVLTGSLEMSEKCGTLKGFGFKKARSIDDGNLKKKKNFERKEENAVNHQFSLFSFPIFSILLKKTVCVLDYI